MHAIKDEVVRVSNSINSRVHGNRAGLLAVRTVREFLDDNCVHLAAGVAYYALFSLFPLLLALISVFGLILEPKEVQDRIVEMVAAYLPGSSDLIAQTVRSVVISRSTVGILALVGLFWSATAFFGAIRRAINHAWDVERQRPFLRQKAVEFAMIGAVGLLFLLSLASASAFRVLQASSLPVLGDFSVGGEGIWAAVTVLFSLAFAFAIFLLMYRVLPNTRVTWGDAWPGALMAAVLFQASQHTFLWYVSERANYSQVYGPLAAVVAFLMWAYISAIVLLLGAEFAAEYSRIIGSRAPDDGPRPTPLPARSMNAGPKPDGK